MQYRKKALDKATEQVIAQAATAGIPLVYDRYEDQVPACGFGRMGLDCKVCTQGPCRINPFDQTNGTACGRAREATVASNFLRLMADGAVANASFAGAEGQVAAAVFSGISMANEGTASADDLLRKAVEVASAGFAALPKANGSAVAETRVGLGTIAPDKLNILLAGSIPTARAKEVAKALAGSPKVNLVGAVGGEAAGLAAAANYGSQEAMLVTTGIDGIVAGRACVSPGFAALAAKQGVPMVDAAAFDAAELLKAAEAHFRMNAGRSLAAKLDSTRATTGFSAAAFKGVSAAQWKSLSALGVKGVALVGGCNNAVETQDAAIVRQTNELLENGILVIATGCAAVGLAKAGYMDTARTGDLAGKALQPFLAALSKSAGAEVPAVLEAGTCWEAPAALELAQLLAGKLEVAVAALMPEVSRPAGWSTALAVAARGVPTYVGPVLPLDGGLQTAQVLNGLLATKGGALMGPGQVGAPEALVAKLFAAQ